MSELMLLCFQLVFNLAIIFPYFMFIERKKKPEYFAATLFCQIEFMGSACSVAYSSDIFFSPQKSCII